MQFIYLHFSKGLVPWQESAGKNSQQAEVLPPSPQLSQKPCSSEAPAEFSAYLYPICGYVFLLLA